MIHRLVFCLPIALAAVGLATGLTPTAVAQQQAAVPVDDLIRVLTNRDAFSEECVSVSRALAARTAEAIPALVQQLPTAGELAQLRILAALSRMGPAAAPALPEVRRLLQAGTPFVRAASADCLRALGDAGREARPDLFKALGDPDPVTVGTAARAIDALDPAFVATRLKDLLDRLGSSPASVDRLTLGTWYCIACRQADDADLARDLRHWMLVVCYTGRDELRVGDALGPGARKSQTESRTVSAAEVRATVLQRPEFGREREGIDLSKVVLTHHTVKNQGKRPMPLGEGDKPKLEPITEVGGGSVQEKQRAYLTEMIRKVNELFEGDLTEQDKLVYVNNVIVRSSRPTCCPRTGTCSTRPATTSPSRRRTGAANSAGT